MEKVTKRFDCDLTPSEFNEVVKVVKKNGKTRREGLLNLIRARNNTIVVDDELTNELLKSIVEKAQKEINEAYQSVVDLYIDAGATLLSTDREKAIGLLAKAFEVKAPTISLP